MLDAVAEIRTKLLTEVQSRRLDSLLNAPSPYLWIRTVGFLREHRILPEAWIYGFTDVYFRSQVRSAFLNGEFALGGWRSFFPYTFLVKTPLALFCLMVLAISTVRTGELTWNSLPLWVFMLVYWVASIESHLNIGHRHILPVYAPLFILCGAAARWFAPTPSGSDSASIAWRKRLKLLLAGATAASLVWLAADVIGFFPNYLAYFNGVVAPHDAYRHLVDSSLDWGQELPATKRYIDRLPASERCYVSYFGTASPLFHGIRSELLFSAPGTDRKSDLAAVVLPKERVHETLSSLSHDWPGYDIFQAEGAGTALLVKKADNLQLHGGTYLISASMLEPVNYTPGEGPWGKWTQGYEKTYRELTGKVAPLLSLDNTVRMEGLSRRGMDEWSDVLGQFEEYRFARLTAFLRHRDPSDEIAYSVLVYRLSDEDIKQALEGAPVELAADASPPEVSDTK